MSFNNNIPVHFFMDEPEYDFKLTISLDGNDNNEREMIMDSLYIELKDEYEPFSLPLEINSYRTRKVIFLKK